MNMDEPFQSALKSKALVIDNAYEECHILEYDFNGIANRYFLFKKCNNITLSATYHVRYMDGAIKVVSLSNADIAKYLTFRKVGIVNE